MKNIIKLLSILLVKTTLISAADDSHAGSKRRRDEAPETAEIVRNAHTKKQGVLPTAPDVVAVTAPESLATYDSDADYALALALSEEHEIDPGSAALIASLQAEDGEYAGDFGYGPAGGAAAHVGYGAAGGGVAAARPVRTTGGLDAEMFLEMPGVYTLHPEHLQTFTKMLDAEALAYSFSASIRERLVDDEISLLIRFGINKYRIKGKYPNFGINEIDEITRSENPGESENALRFLSVLKRYRDSLEQAQLAEFNSHFEPLMDYYKDTKTEVEAPDAARLVKSIRAYIAYKSVYGPRVYSNLANDVNCILCVQKLEMDPHARQKIWELLKRSGLVESSIEAPSIFSYSPARSIEKALSRMPDSKTLVIGCGHFLKRDFIFHLSGCIEEASCGSCFEASHEDEITFCTEASQRPDFVASAHDPIVWDTLYRSGRRFDAIKDHGSLVGVGVGEDGSALLKQIHRSLNPDGLLIIEGDNDDRERTIKATDLFEFLDRQNVPGILEPAETHAITLFKKREGKA